MKSLLQSRLTAVAAILAALITLSAGLSAGTRVSAQIVPGQPVQSAAELAGTWERERSDSNTYQKITLVLRADGTYTKNLVAKVNGAPFGGTHEGTWTAKGSTVYLSGDGNWPALSHDLSEFRRVS